MAHREKAKKAAAEQVIKGLDKACFELTLTNTLLDMMALAETPHTDNYETLREGSYKLMNLQVEIITLKHELENLEFFIPERTNVKPSN